MGEEAMPIRKKWTLLGKSLDNTPTGDGIYEFGAKIGKTMDVVYIGKASGAGGIRARVVSHINGRGNMDLAKLITRGKHVRVRWQECTTFGQSAQSLEQDALEDFEGMHGCLPYANMKRESDKHTHWDRIVRFINR